MLERYEGKYGDFGPTRASEDLRKCEGECVGVETLRPWLVAAGLWNPRRRGAVHRQWRERKGHFGEMVQRDGSLHDWLAGRRGKASLRVMIDDATNRTHAQFFEAETTAAAMTVFRSYVDQYGLPHALYVDRDSIYLTTRDSSVDEAFYFARPKVTHLNVATFRQNVGLLSVPPALWRGAATSQFGPREAFTSTPPVTRFGRARAVWGVT